MRVTLNPLLLRLTSGGRRSRLTIVRHVGRRSGRAYATQVIALRVRDGFLVPLTYGTRADWCRNVLAAGRATLVRAGAETPVDRPEVLGLAAVLPALAPGWRLLFRTIGMELFLLFRATGPDRDP